MFDILFPAWLAGVLLSFVTAPLGAFVVWRKMAYFGDTLSHSALLGVALGIFLETNPYWCVIFTTLLLAVLLVVIEKQTHYSLDTILGIIAHSCLSLGILTISFLDNVRVDLLSYLFGDLLAVDFNDVMMIGFGVLIIVALLIWYWKPLLSMTVNPEIAQIEGLNIFRLRMLLMCLTAFTIALSMKFVGALIITSLLIIPSAIARRFAQSPEAMVFYAIGMSILSISGGLCLSAWQNSPAGPSVVVCAGGLFLISLWHKK